MPEAEPIFFSDSKEAFNGLKRKLDSALFNDGLELVKAKANEMGVSPNLFDGFQVPVEVDSSYETKKEPLEYRTLWEDLGIGPRFDHDWWMVHTKIGSSGEPISQEIFQYSGESEEEYLAKAVAKVWLMKSNDGRWLEWVQGRKGVSVSVYSFTENKLPIDPSLRRWQIDMIRVSIPDWDDNSEWKFTKHIVDQHLTGGHCGEIIHWSEGVQELEGKRPICREVRTQLVNEDGITVEVVRLIRVPEGVLVSTLSTEDSFGGDYVRGMKEENDDRDDPDSEYDSFLPLDEEEVVVLDEDGDWEDDDDEQDEDDDWDEDEQVATITKTAWFEPGYDLLSVSQEDLFAYVAGKHELNPEDVSVTEEDDLPLLRYGGAYVVRWSERLVLSLLHDDTDGFFSPGDLDMIYFRESGTKKVIVVLTGPGGEIRGVKYAPDELAEQLRNELGE